MPPITDSLEPVPPPLKAPETVGFRTIRPLPSPSGAGYIGFGTDGIGAGHGGIIGSALGATASRIQNSAIDGQANDADQGDQQKDDQDQSLTGFTVSLPI